MAYPARSVIVGIDNGGTMNNATVLDPDGRFLVQQIEAHAERRLVTAPLLEQHIT